MHDNQADRRTIHQVFTTDKAMSSTTNVSHGQLTKELNIFQVATKMWLQFDKTKHQIHH